MIIRISLPVWIQQRVDAVADRIFNAIYDWNVDHADQQPSIDLRDITSETGWAIACAKSVYVELHYDQDRALHRRWSAWSRLHYQGHSINVTGAALTGPAAVRKVRRGLAQELRELPLTPASGRRED